MQGLRDRVRRTVAPERLAYARERGFEVAIAEAGVVASAAQAEAAQAQLDVVGLADGTTPFTGLNVGGDDKVGFLGKVAAGALSDASGLANALISTAKIAVEAVTTVDVDFDATTVNVTTTAESTLVTVPVTVLAGEKVDLQGIVDVLAVYGGSPTGDVAATISVLIYRDSSLLIARTTRAIKSVVVAAPVPTSWNDEPAAGSYNYTLRVSTNNVTGLSTLSFSNAHMTATRIKR